MNCLKVQDLLSPYLDQALSEEEMSLVEKHLKKCSSCSQELADLKNTLNMIQTLPELPLPDDFQMDLHRKLVAAKQETAKNKRKGWLYHFPSRWASLSMAAVLLLVLYTFISPLIPRLGQQSDQTAPSAVHSGAGAELAAEDSTINGVKIALPERSGEVVAERTMKEKFNDESTGAEREFQNDAGLKSIPDYAGQEEFGFDATAQVDEKNKKKSAATYPAGTVQSRKESSGASSLEQEGFPASNGTFNNEINNTEITTDTTDQNLETGEGQRQGEVARGSVLKAGISSFTSEKEPVLSSEKPFAEPRVMEFKIKTNRFNDIYHKLTNLVGKMHEEKGTYFMTIDRDRLPQVLSLIESTEKEEDSVWEDVYGYALIKIMIQDQAD